MGEKERGDNQKQKQENEKTRKQEKKRVKIKEKGGTLRMGRKKERRGMGRG